MTTVKTEEIIKKLWDSDFENLTSEEIKVISMSLKKNNKEEEISVIPFDHNKESHSEACGVTKSEQHIFIDKINKGMAALGGANNSKITEIMENLLSEDNNPYTKRIICLLATISMTSIARPVEKKEEETKSAIEEILKIIRRGNDGKKE